MFNYIRKYSIRRKLMHIMLVTSGVVLVMFLPMRRCHFAP
jgi:hypothetical protein